MVGKKVNGAIQAEEIRRLSKAYGLDASFAYWNCSAAALSELTAGCGPGRFGDKFVPDDVSGLNLLPACQIHDFDYSHLSDVSKALADARFFANMRRSMRAQDNKINLYKRIAWRFIICKYFDAVDIYGKGARGVL